MPTLIDTIQAWLVDNTEEYTLPFDELQKIFAAHPGELDGVTCARAVAVAQPEDGLWTLFLPAGEWISGGFRLQGSVYVIPTEEPPYLSDWETLRGRAEFRIKPETVSSHLDMGDSNWYSLPFFFDGPSWEGVGEDLNDGDGEWFISVNDQYDTVYAGDVIFGYDDHTEYQFPPEEILEIECEWPMVDNEGQFLTVHRNGTGGIAIHHQGFFAVYVGRNPNGLTISEMIEQNVPTFKPNRTVAVWSKKLNCAEIADVLAWLERVDPNLDPQKCEISGPDFDGTLEQLRQASRST